MKSDLVNFTTNFYLDMAFCLQTNILLNLKISIKTKNKRILALQSFFPFFIVFIVLLHLNIQNFLGSQVGEELKSILASRCQKYIQMNVHLNVNILFYFFFAILYIIIQPFDFRSEKINSVKTSREVVLYVCYQYHARGNAK